MRGKTMRAAAPQKRIGGHGGRSTAEEDRRPWRPLHRRRGAAKAAVAATEAAAAAQAAHQLEEEPQLLGRGLQMLRKRTPALRRWCWRLLRGCRLLEQAVCEPQVKLLRDQARFDRKGRRTGCGVEDLGPRAPKREVGGAA